jgi:hypothetical protein
MSPTSVPPRTFTNLSPADFDLPDSPGDSDFEVTLFGLTHVERRSSQSRENERFRARLTTE